MIERLKRYLARLGQKIIISDGSHPSGLPLFVVENNDWHEMSLNGESLLLCVSKKPLPAPQDVVVLWNTLVSARKDSILVIAPRDDAFCAFLDAAKVSYIMPGARLNVPGKMVLVTRHVSPDVNSVRDYLSLDAQLVVLWYLLKGSSEHVKFADVREGTRLDKSHMTRAAQELERLEIAAIDRVWRSNELVFSWAKADIWRDWHGRMRSPVLRRIRLAEPVHGLPIAGVEALAERSMLEPDPNPVYAVKRGDKRIDESLDAKYDGAVVEIWRYEPLIFSNDNQSVDTLSLYLSFGGEADPRIRKELEVLMENMKW